MDTSKVLHNPLVWPPSQPRTRAVCREKARFEVFLETALHELLEELRLLGAQNVVLTTNVPVRKDGKFYQNQEYSIVRDPGIALYFSLDDKPFVFACDHWETPKDNLRAIGLHISALRGIERWAVGSDGQAFVGYQALPETGGTRPWWIVLAVEPKSSLEEIKAAYRQKARQYHPDSGKPDSHDRMAEVNRAWEEARSLYRA